MHPKLSKQRHPLNAQRSTLQLASTQEKWHHHQEVLALLLLRFNSLTVPARSSYNLLKSSTLVCLRFIGFSPFFGPSLEVEVTSKLLIRFNNPGLAALTRGIRGGGTCNSLPVDGRFAEAGHEGFLKTGSVSVGMGEETDLC